MKIGNIADKDAALKSNYANVRQEDKVGKEQKGKFDGYLPDQSGDQSLAA